MLFKQLQLLKLKENISLEAITKHLELLKFSPCLPSAPASMGWVSPLDEEDDAPLTRVINGCAMIALQIEDKILPSSVVNLALKAKVKKIENTEDRKVRKKEKLTLKDDVTQTLLQRAFTKLSKLYAYVDTRNKWVILNSISPKKTELFLSMFTKAFGEIIESIEVVKPATIMTQWLREQQFPREFTIESACTLQDPNEQTRVIRCQQQDLFAGSIQELIKDGCEVIQLALCWQGRLTFVLSNQFNLRSISLADDDLADIKEDIESARQQFDAEFFMMTEMYTKLLEDLLSIFKKSDDKPQKLALVS